jgi:Sec-independent protein translocase protein TatA
MDFLGIGPIELIAIFIIAFLVLGPQDLVKLGGNLGRTLRNLRRSEVWRVVQDAGRQIRELPDTLARQAGIDEIKEMQSEIKGEIEEQKAELKAIDKQVSAWTRSPQPLSQKAKGEEDKPTSKNGSEGTAT